MNVKIPSVAGAANMELQSIGQRDGADQGDPQVSAKTISNDGSIHVGVWECTPGGWPITDRGDTEVASILQRSYDEAKKLLVDNRDVLDRVALALLERETLETEELDLLLKNQDLPPFEKIIRDASAKGTKKTPESESSDGFSAGSVPDPEPMPS